MPCCTLKPFRIKNLYDKLFVIYIDIGILHVTIWYLDHNVVYNKHQTRYKDDDYTYMLIHFDFVTCELPAEDTSLICI